MSKDPNHVTLSIKSVKAQLKATVRPMTEEEKKRYYGEPEKDQPKTSEYDDAAE